MSLMSFCWSTPKSTESRPPRSRRSGGYVRWGRGWGAPFGGGGGRGRGTPGRKEGGDWQKKRPRPRPPPPKPRAGDPRGWGGAERLPPPPPFTNPRRYRECGE